MSTYLVTGANRGIGLAFARLLSQRGDRVIATAPHPEKARDLAKLSVRVEPLDVAEKKSISGLARRLAGEPIDALINNAGIGDAGPKLARLDREELETTFRVNAVGPLFVTQALLPNLRKGKRRLVVSLTSGLASLSSNEEGGWYAYRASKAALNQLTRTMAAELKSQGFVCVVICPGWVRTDMGGSEAPLSAEESVEAMLQLVDRLNESHNGRFLDRRGREVEW